jgi:hypothetical protein
LPAVLPRGFCAEAEAEDPPIMPRAFGHIIPRPPGPIMPPQPPLPDIMP